MKKYTIYTLLLTLSFGCNEHSRVEKEIISLKNPRCELLTNPIGIDIRQPNLSWELQSGQRDILQTAYHVLVASSKEVLDQNKGDVWDSGKIPSDQSVYVQYHGNELTSNTIYYWKVKVWSQNGESNWSEPAQWQTGYFYYKEWKGRWIGLDRAFPGEVESKFSRLAARYFRNEFETEKKDIVNATAYIMGLGLYELYLNGEKVGDQVLAPSPTDYTKNVKYNAYDVTKKVQKGQNTIGVILGNGYFFTMRQHYKPYKIKNFGYPKLLFNLVIKYSDGSTDVVSTDNSWKATVDGPVRANNIYDGEEYDAREEMPGWGAAGFDDKKWFQAEYVQGPGGEYEAGLNGNMKIMKELKPVTITKKKDNRYILDMGQNMAGWLRIRVKGKRGEKVTLRFAESLTNEGELFTAPLRDARATDVYILKGGGTETWEPRFVYHGFRFAEISGYSGTPAKEDFTGCVVYDEMTTTGSFQTSNKVIDQIYTNAFWSINATYKGMPIDCPQRNERMPWLGDRAIGCYGESFVMDNSRLYVKWLDDIMYTQKADGSISDVAPPFFRYYSDNMTWPGTYIFVAEMLYHQYGLTGPIRKHYPHMKKWLEYMVSRYLKDYILTKDSYGDWCPPPKTIEEGRGKSANVKRPSELISTAYYYHFLNIMQKFAEISGNNPDIPVYRKQAKNVKNAFNEAFFHTENATYGDNKLTDNLLAAYFGLVPDGRIGDVLKSIENIIITGHNGHLSSGLVGVQWLMRTLGNNGYEELAYKLASNTTYPSWGYMVEQGATTIWELWNANTAAPNMNSQNHVMLLGDLIIWFFEDLAGIKSNSEKPGFKEIMMKPDFTDDLDFVEASYQSVYGMVKSEWDRNPGKIVWDVQIPANTTAVIHFPTTNKERISLDGNMVQNGFGIEYIKTDTENVIYKIGSGGYTFEIKQ